QNWDIDALEICEEFRFRKDPDALPLSLDATHHVLAPPIVANALRNFRAGTIEAVKRNGDVLIELGAMVTGAIAKLVEHLHGKAIGIFVGLDQLRRNRADEDGFGDA